MKKLKIELDTDFAKAGSATMAAQCGNKFKFKS